MGRIAGRLTEALGLTPPWHADLCRWFHVTPRQVAELGTRRAGRRPDLPGSPTCQPVSGKTWEDIWASRPRDSDGAIMAFYREIGAWSAFRQVVRHRFRSWSFVARQMPRNGVLVEWGAGVAPVSFWLATHPWQVGGEPTFVLADVDSEHYTFGRWRLAEADGEAIELFVEADKPLPSLPPADVVCVLETLEHLPSPLRVIEHLGAAVKPGGVLFEDFFLHDRPSGADLPQATKERGQVYSYLSAAFTREAGRDWMAPDGGGLRRWRKRQF